MHGPYIPFARSEDEEKEPYRPLHVRVLEKVLRPSYSKDASRDFRGIIFKLILKPKINLTPKPQHQSTIKPDKHTPVQEKKVQTIRSPKSRPCI